MRILAFIILFFGVTQTILSQTVVLRGDTTDNIFHLRATNHLPCPSFLEVTFDSLEKNFQQLVPKGGDRALVKLPIDTFTDIQKLAENMTLDLILGDPDTIHDSAYQYMLPYPEGESYKLIQGTNSDFTHNNISNRYAYDFQMPEGSPVSAARGGVVGFVRDNFEEGDKDKELKHKGNQVLVCHDDGTIATYGHLKHKGALANIGDHVYAGQVIGLSGNTGYSTTPHLHFAVMIGNRSIPIRFRNLPDSLIEGKFYEQKLEFGNR